MSAKEEPKLFVSTAIPNVIQTQDLWVRLILPRDVIPANLDGDPPIPLDARMGHPLRRSLETIATRAHSVETAAHHHGYGVLNEVLRPAVGWCEGAAVLLAKLSLETVLLRVFAVADIPVDRRRDGVIRIRKEHRLRPGPRPRSLRAWLCSCSLPQPKHAHQRRRNQTLYPFYSPPFRSPLSPLPR